MLPRARTTPVERRPLTGVFCDLVGSSELATRMDPEDYAGVLVQFHKRVRATMERYGGFFARPMGDGALVFFGFPRAEEDDLERAVRASLATVEAVRTIDVGSGRRLHVKIGVATGIAIVGDVVEVENQRGLDAAGEALNLAARLQDIAEPDTVLVTEAVRQLLGPLFVYRNLGTRQVKGWTDPVRIVQVLEPAADLDRFRARTPHQLPPLIGRDREIGRLRRLWAAARDGAGSVVLLTGDAGIGKSRLAAQLLLETEAEPHVRLRWFAAAHQEGIPLHPCLQQIRNAAGLAVDDPPEQRRSKLENVLGDAPEEDFVLIASLLLADVDWTAPVLQSSPQRRRERTLQALFDWVVRVCRRRPVLGVLEDAHWCDPTTAELLGMVARAAGTLPLLVVVTARPEFRPDWLAAEGVESISLRPLPPGESATLIDAVAGADGLRRNVVEAIVARCDGVPLYLEEITKAVVEDVGGGDPARPRASPAAVPPSIHASLLSRLDRLGTVRAVAEVAAAIGRDFGVDLLAHVHQGSSASLLLAIRSLIDAGLVLPNGPAGSGRLRFKHALIQDTAYGVMVRERRRAVHRSIAGALENHFPQTGASEPQLLAHHCAEAGLTEKATGWWLRAATQSLMHGATTEALAHLNRGLELNAALPDGAERQRQELDLQIVLGKVIVATKGHAIPAARAAFARARALCAGLGHSPQLLTVLFGQWTHALLRADFAAARRQSDELTMLAGKTRDRVWKLVACYAAGFTHFALGSFASAHRYLGRGLRLFDPARRQDYARPVVGDPRVLLNTYFAWERLCVGRFAEAQAACDEAVSEARTLRQSYSLAHALSKEAYLRIYLAAPEAALAVAKELQSLADERGIAFFSAAATIFRGWCLGLCGETRDGLALVRRATELYRRTETLLHIPSFLRVEAEILGRCGQAETGLARIFEAQAMLAQSGERWEEAEIRRTEGELLARLGRAAAAEVAYRDAHCIAVRQGARLFALRASVSLAELLGAEGRRADATAALAAAIARFEPESVAPDLARARGLLSAFA
jgi:predicted ATPase/class 3 adenylate cyclase